MGIIKIMRSGKNESVCLSKIYGVKVSNKRLVGDISLEKIAAVIRRVKPFNSDKACFCEECCFLYGVLWGMISAIEKKRVIIEGLIRKIFCDAR